MGGPPRSRAPLGLIAVVLAEVVSVLTVLVVAGQEPWSGPVVVRLSQTHGVHALDVPVVALWAVAMGCCWSLWRRWEP